MKKQVALALNEQYRQELEKLVQMQKAADRQQDIVIDLHLKYVKAVNDDKNWK